MKKMRRLIPAIAMLLVSAVMLSTASFAWFTMSENASATGMQVQAKASGSLLIDNKPLNDASKLTSVSLDTGAHVLTPITIKKDTSNQNTTITWQKPKDGNLVDPTTGLAGTTGLETVTPVAGQDYFEEIIYLGSAGDPLEDQKLTITLKAPIASTGEAVKAYSAAIYVSTGTSWTSGEAVSNVTNATVPTHILHVDTYDEDDDATNGARNIVILDNGGAGYDIPSVVGVQGDSWVGLRVVIRIYIDGDLRSPDEIEVTTTDYVAVGKNEDGTAKKYDPDETYYVQTNGVWGLANDYGYTAESDLPENWATIVESDGESEYNYINSKDVPVTGSTLQLDFKVADVNPSQNQGQ